MTNLSQFLEGLRQIISDADLSDMKVTSLVGGASFRTYYRVECRGKSWVVMVLAEEPLRSEEASSGPSPDGLPFLDIGRFLATRGVPVPDIHLVDRRHGHLWLDDLGDTHFLAWLEQGGERHAGYQRAIDTLVSFQVATRFSAHGSPSAPPRSDRPQPDTPSLICYQRSFEPDLLRWELDHWTEWRVQAQLNRTPPQHLMEILNTSFDDLVYRITEQPQILVHRDFQSTNLMVDIDAKKMTLIDFQDALIGPWTYDLVALLRDSYVDLDFPIVEQLIDEYLAALETSRAVGSPSVDHRSFHRDFHLQTLQRKLKDAGRFVYIDRVKGDPTYLRFIPRTMRFVREALEWLEEEGSTPHIATLASALRAVDPESFA